MAKRTVHVGVFLEEELATAIDVACRKLNMTRSAYGRMLFLENVIQKGIMTPEMALQFMEGITFQ